MKKTEFKEKLLEALSESINGMSFDEKAVVYTKMHFAI
jgi:hypothetical protein